MTARELLTEERARFNKLIDAIDKKLGADKDPLVVIVGAFATNTALLGKILTELVYMNDKELDGNN